MNRAYDSEQGTTYEGSGWSGSGYWDHRDLIRRKDEWAKVSLARAFDPDASWASKQIAQSRFYQAANRIQKAALRLVGGSESPDRTRAKAQLAAAYTNHPIGPQAALGHTAFLEVHQILGDLRTDIAGAILRLERAKEARIDVKTYCLVGGYVASAIAHRQIVEEAARYPELALIELYRLFQASTNTLQFQYLRDVIECAVLFGDVLPSMRCLRLHPMTRQILAAINAASRAFWEKLRNSPTPLLPDFFKQWGNRLLEALIPFMPPENKEDVPARPSSPLRKGLSLDDDEETPHRFGLEHPDGPESPDFVPPLDNPRPPQLEEPATPAQAMMQALNKLLQDDRAAASPQQDEGPSSEMAKTLKELAETVAQASGQKNDWEDMREDLILEALARSAFGEGPIEGTPTQGHSIELELDGNEVGGQIFGRPVELSENMTQIERLRRDAHPITDVLRRNLYPSTSEHPVIERAHTSGQLDPHRLPLAEVSEAVFNRYCVYRKPNPEGRAVLVIAADASASLSERQMRMCKLLTAAWLESAQRSRVQVLAALYHSGAARKEMTGPLVQWVYHPRKTPVMNPREAVRAVASLPDRGTGRQSDALSLAYILDEAVPFFHGGQVYLVLISDVAWNKSFNGFAATPVEEVAQTLKTKREMFDGQMHVTLVALERSVQEEIAKAVDQVVAVTDEELGNPEAVAKKIGEYVAKCIRQRRRG